MLSSISGVESLINESLQSFYWTVDITYDK